MISNFVGKKRSIWNLLIIIQIRLIHLFKNTRASTELLYCYNLKIQLPG